MYGAACRATIAARTGREGVADAFHDHTGPVPLFLITWQPLPI